MSTKSPAFDCGRNHASGSLQRSSLYLAALIAGQAALASTAQAQTRIEEIVVSAQRIEQSLQDVPIAVTAFTAEDLENRGISGVESLTGGHVPSIQVQQFAGRPGEMQISIRGVGGSDPAQVSFEQGVAIYNDGVYYARGGLGLSVLELERMEVLRGPQGQLFGRNALGGAVNMIPRKPGGEFRFKETLEYGRFGTFMSHTTLETNEWNNLAFKFDFRRSKTDGWQDNPWQGPEKGANDFAREKQDSYRVAARWTPTSSFTADYAFDRTQLWYVQSYNHVITGSNVPALAPFIAPFVHEDRQREAPAPGLYAPLSTNEANGHFLNLSWTPLDNVTVKSITAYREFEVLSNALNGFGIASPGSGPFAGQLLGGQNTIENTHQRQFSQEFLLSGDVERLEYTVGAIYFSEDASNTNWSRFTMRTPFTSVNWQPFDPQFETPKTITGVKLKSWGVFGQATWTPPILDDRLALTAGVRYSHDNKDLLRTQLLDQPVNLPIENNVSRVDPAFTLDFKWTDSISTYVRWATGYRGGGASVRELPAPSLDPNDTGFNEFDIEKVEATEVGLKADFWDGRARLNAALFYQKYKDKQVSFQKDSVSNTRVFNINKPVKLKGGEAEFTLVPVDGLTLTASATQVQRTWRTTSTACSTPPAAWKSRSGWR